MYHNGFRSFYRLNAHIVLVVKSRRKAINAEILNRFKEIITDTLKKWDCELLEFNGEADHVHLLMEYYLAQNPELNFKLANFSLGTELYGFVLPIDSSLKKDLNIELLRMSENGSLQAITSRWLSSTNSEI